MLFSETKKILKGPARSRTLKQTSNVTHPIVKIEIKCSHDFEVLTFQFLFRNN